MRPCGPQSCHLQSVAGERRRRLPRLLLLLLGALVLPAAPLVGSTSTGIIVISEIMYHPAGGGQGLEYIELFNNTPAPIDLSGWFFSRGISYEFPAGTILRGRRYLVVCADAERVRLEYGIANAVGDWCGEGAPDDAACALDNGGETIELSEANGVVHTRVTYNDRGKWPSAADGTGHSLEMVDTYGEQDDPDSWSISARCRKDGDSTGDGGLRQGGSPGGPNASRELRSAGPPVKLNEALLLTAGERWIELFNEGDVAVDLSGCFVSTSRALTRDAVLPEGSILPARSWLVVTEDELGVDLAATASRDEEGATGSAGPSRRFLALVSPDGSRVVDARLFEPRSAERSEARLPDGGRRFSASAVPTPGAANRTGVEQDVVISEIHYHPPGDDPDAEFVELLNRGDHAVDLTGWRLASGVRYRFAAGQVLDAGRYLVIARSPGSIAEMYGLPPSSVVGPSPEDPEALAAFGRLSNDGERIELVDALDNTVDSVRYHDGGDWPGWCDGGGSSLELIDPGERNDVAAAWDASDDSAKAPVERFEYEARFYGGEPELHLALLDAGIALVDDLEVRERTVSVETRRTLIGPSETWRYRKVREPPSARPGAWAEPGFDDSSWSEGPAPIGYGDAGVATVLDDMRGGYPSVCIRRTFRIDDPASMGQLVLDVEYDDGLTVYLNGREVALRNLPPGSVTAGSLAREHVQRTREPIEIVGSRELLVAGTNVLGLIVHNASLASSDCFLEARLVDGSIVREDGPDLVSGGDFESPIVTDRSTPGAWYIQGTHIRSGRSLEGPISGGASLKIVATGKGDNKVNRIETALPPLTPNHTYAVSFRARWVVGSPRLLTHGYQGYDLARSHRLVVPTQLGTPGAPNSASLRRIRRTGDANGGPLIEGLRQTPPLPGPGEDVEVRVRAIDSDGVASVRLFWSLEAPAPPGSPEWRVIDMAGPDSRAEYRAMVPGQPSGARVVLYLAGEDGEGRLSRYPVSPLERTHPCLLDPDAPGIPDHGYIVYGHEDPAESGGLTYRLWLHRLDEEYLDRRQLHSQDLVEGSLVVDDRQIHHRTRVRFSGSPYARAPWTGSYRVSMPKDRPLWGAIKRFNLEWHQVGGGPDGRERISSYLIRHNQGAGRVPYFYQWLVRCRVEGRVDQILEHVATPDGEFLERWFPGDDDGAFLEMNIRHTFTDGGGVDTSQDARLESPPYARPGMAADDREQYRWFFSLRRDEAGDDYRHLVDLAGLMTPSITPDEEFDRRVLDALDLEAFLRVWAVRMNTDDWDSWGCRRGKNCYLYRPARDGRWVMIPWDMELTYQAENAFLPPPIEETYRNMFSEVERLLNRPRIKRRYYGILHEMVRGPFRPEFLEPYLDALDDAGVARTDVGRPGGYIDRRRVLIEERLRSAVFPAVRVEITTNDGEPFESKTRAVSLEGRAPVDVSRLELLVDEAHAPGDVDLAGVGVFSFRVESLLPEGHHELTVLGLDGAGRLVDFDSIAIDVNPSPEEPPRFLRGDADGSGSLAVSDPVAILLHLLRGSELRCLDAADADDDGSVRISDAVVVLRWLFLAGTPPAPPFPTVAEDPTADEIGCEARHSRLD